MLWHKAWRESRVRFLVSAAVLSFLCASFVNGARHNFPPIFEPTMPYSVFIWRGIYNGPNRLLFVLMVLVLGLGGLQRERASGTAACTLALPVGRFLLVSTRAAVGFLEVATLSVIPVLIVPMLSLRIGHFYPTTQAVQFALLFTSAGAVWLAAGFLMSTALTSEHTPTAGCVLAPFLYLAIVNGSSLQRFPAINLFNVMNGSRMPYFDPKSAFLIGPPPWTTLAVLAIVAVGLLSVAARVTQRQDF